MLSIPSLGEVCRFLSDPALDGRFPGSAGHEQARKYLTDKLERLGFAPLFSGKWGQPMARNQEVLGENLGGIKAGSSGRTLLVGAHYDHFQGIPGADDNAAALAILIETCRLLDPWHGSHNLVLCFFDLEESPHYLTGSMGSVYFTKHCPIDLDKLDCAIVLDLCGHDTSIPGREDALFVLGAEYSPDLVQVIQSTESPGVSTYMARNDRIGDMSDHHAFRLAGRPFLFLSCGWWKHYHQPTDTFDRLNLAKMEGIVGLLREIVLKLDGLVVRPTPVQDFGRIEAESLKRLLGGQLSLVSEDSVTEVIRRLWR